MTALSQSSAEVRAILKEIEAPGAGSLRSHLLGSLSGPAYQPRPKPACTSTVARGEPPASAAEMLAGIEAVMDAAPRMRRGPGSAPWGGIPIEPSPLVPVGWFMLREPGQPPYTDLMPMASLNALYRTGDILMLAPETVSVIPSDRPAPEPPGASEEEG